MADTDTHRLIHAADALSQLRHLTQPHHKALEDALGLDRPQMDRASYIALLRRFHALYRTLEAETCPSGQGLAQWQSELSQVGFSWQERRKLPLLDCDLAALSVAPLPSEEGPDGQLALGSLPAVLGCLYVLEGSTLGGQYICRKLQSQLGLSPDRGLAFFSGYAQRTGLMWRQMRTILAQRLQSEADIASAVQAAQDTFLLFRRWLPRPR